MAFKTKEQIAELRARQTPYTYQDETLFRNKNIRTGTVELHYDLIRREFGSRLYRADATHNGVVTAIEILFSGQRLQDLVEGRILKEFQKAHELACEAGDYHSTRKRTLTIEGFWTPRRWTDNNDKAHTKWRLTAAWWQGKDLETGETFEEGSHILPTAKEGTQ